MAANLLNEGSLPAYFLIHFFPGIPIENGLMEAEGRVEELIIRFQ